MESISCSAIDELPAAALRHIVALLALCPADPAHPALERLRALQVASRALRDAVRAYIASVATRIEGGQPIAAPRPHPYSSLESLAALQHVDMTHHQSLPPLPASSGGSGDVPRHQQETRRAVRRFLCGARPAAPAAPLPSPTRIATLRFLKVGALAFAKLPASPLLSALTRISLSPDDAGDACGAARRPKGGRGLPAPPWSTLDWGSAAAALLRLPRLADVELSEAPLVSRALALALPRMPALTSLALHWAAFDEEGADAPTARRAAQWLPTGGGGACFWAAATQLRALSLPAVVLAACGASVAPLTRLTALNANLGTMTPAAAAGIAERLLLGFPPGRAARCPHAPPPPPPPPPLLPLSPLKLAAAVPPWGLAGLRELAAITSLAASGCEQLLFDALSALPRLRSLELVAAWAAPPRRRQWWQAAPQENMGEGEDLALVLPRDACAYAGLSGLTSLVLSGFQRPAQLPPLRALERLARLARLRVAGGEGLVFDGPGSSVWLDSLGTLRCLRDLDLEPR
jgi:hypothetical protein